MQKEIKEIKQIVAYNLIVQEEILNSINNSSDAPSNYNKKEKTLNIEITKQESDEKSKKWN